MNGYDKCRSTYKSKNVSQNIFKGSDLTPVPIETLFTRALSKWTKDAALKISHIAKFIATPVIGNFTQIIHETAYKVGCAAARWVAHDKYEFEVVCNYNAGHLKGRQIYLAGDLNCTTGSSSRYPHLCSIDEPPVSPDCSLVSL
jgi:hypothetical protein